VSRVKRYQRFESGFLQRGLALGIVLECDLIVAAAGTKFRVTETSRGLGGAKYWAC
jgi:hypothetical protein